MSDSNRLDPDAILRAIDTDEISARAHLRIFLGMSAGVGKTYAMLQAAHQRVHEGLDVVIGVVETHGRNETAALLAGLPIIPRRRLNYRGTELDEMDLDAILARRPKIVIVDELAHTNIPGSRHEKRYQDVLEILDAGIDVYTALNVQHLESRKDMVESITGIKIRESVPDSILERATQVELVDIAPSELLKRLREGKIYLGDKADRAAKNFFKEDRLTALREISLRITAERVDQDLQRLSSVRQDQPWQTNERILVAISHSPYSEKLIRATRRLAYNLEAPWIALHVDTGISLNDADQEQLAKNLNLARELKGEVIATSEIDVAMAIKRICRQKNVTQVIVGRPTRRWFRDVIEGGSLLNRLVRESLEVDVHVIRQDITVNYRPSILGELALYRSKTGPIKYWYTLWFLLMISVLGGVLEPFIGYRAVGFLYLIAVLTVGMFGSIGAVVFAALTGAVAWDFFFIPPRFTFIITQVDDFMLCVAYFVVALIVGFLTYRLRFHERVIRVREERTQVLYELLQDMSSNFTRSNSKKTTDLSKDITNDISAIPSKALTRIGKLFSADCQVVLATQNYAGQPIVEGPLDFSRATTTAPIPVTSAVDPLPNPGLKEEEKAVALWCFQKQKAAGWSTDTLSQSEALYLPMRGQTDQVGVFIFKPQKKNRPLDLEQETLLFSVIRQMSIAIERRLIARQLIAAQRLQDSEQLHQILLSSISHEMRTPLTAIMGGSAALQDPQLIHSPAQLAGIGESLQEAADRLNHVIENLLDMSRLNSGVLSLKLEWHDLSDLIGVVTQKLSKQLLKHPLELNFSPDLQEHLPLMHIDYRLLEHALANLLLNSTMYAPAGSPIQIGVQKKSQQLVISVSDQGPGIPAAYLDKVFDKFFRVPGSPTGGTGLGLSIVKNIVELHKGHVQVENLQPHGVRFSIFLPIEKGPRLPQEEST